jgi:hypothetical protein
MSSVVDRNCYFIGNARALALLAMAFVLLSELVFRGITATCWSMMWHPLAARQHPCRDDHLIVQEKRIQLLTH